MAMKALQQMFGYGAEDNVAVLSNSSDESNFYVLDEIIQNSKKFNLMKRDLILKLKEPKLDTNIIEYLEKRYNEFSNI